MLKIKLRAFVLNPSGSELLLPLIQFMINVQKTALGRALFFYQNAERSELGMKSIDSHYSAPNQIMIQHRYFGIAREYSARIFARYVWSRY